MYLVYMVCTLFLPEMRGGAQVDRVDTGTVRDWAGSVPKDRAYMMGRSD